MGMNFQDVIRDVHDESLHSLKTTASLSASTVYVGNPTLYAVVNTTASSGLATVNINGSATIFAVVNTSAAGVGNSIVTVANPNFGINAGLNNIGFATVAVSTPTIYAVVNTGGANTGNITLNPSPNQIGSVTVSNPVTIASSVNNIGFATVAVSTPTIYAVVNTTASSGLATVNINNGVGNIGFATVAISNSVGNATLNPSPNFIGIVTVANPGTFAGNVTITDGKTYIGLTTTTLGAGLSGIGFATVAVSTPTLFAVVNTAAAGVGNSIVTVANPNFGINAGVNNIGFASVTPVSAWPNPNTFIGLVTVAPHSLTASTLNIGSVSVLGGTINATLQTSTLNIGSVSILGGSIVNSAGVNGIGFVTASLAPSPQYIGLVTAVNAYGSGSTVFTGVISATGNTTILVAPASNRFFIKNIHVASLGRAEVEFKSGATTLIPFTSLSTTAGFAEHFGEMGLPARAQTDALVANLNGSATISYMVNVRFEA